MGRHRRSGPDAAPVSTLNRGQGHRSRRGAHRRGGPPRTRLFGASAALTVGAVALGTGLLPSVAERLVPDDSTDFRGQEPFPQTTALDGLTTPPTLEPDEVTPQPSGGEDDRRPAPETTRPEAEPSSRTTTEPDPEPSESTEEPSDPPTATSPSPTTESPTTEPDPSPSNPLAGDPPEESEDPAAAAAAAVLTLVNEERAAAGCEPLTHDPALAELATDLSRDMAERGFFDHTDPDGRTPWDRAEEAGISNLGGENIAWGQPDAESVMAAWMDSEGHRANILNCSFRTIGVGVHFADGSAWWTQDFGY